MYLHPERVSSELAARVARWLDANGCRHWVALEPITLKGQHVEYTALCRRYDAKSIERQMRGDVLVPLGRKRLRIRIPFHKVP